MYQNLKEEEAAAVKAIPPELEGQVPKKYAQGDEEGDSKATKG